MQGSGDSFGLPVQPMVEEPRGLARLWRPIFKSPAPANDLPRDFIIAHPDEGGMPQPIVKRPLQEINCDDDPRLEPTARVHLIGREPMSAGRSSSAHT